MQTISILFPSTSRGSSCPPPPRQAQAEHLAQGLGAKEKTSVEQLPWPVASPHQGHMLSLGLGGRHKCSSFPSPPQRKPMTHFMVSCFSPPSNVAVNNPNQFLGFVFPSFSCPLSQTSRQPTGLAELSQTQKTWLGWY